MPGCPLIRASAAETVGTSVFSRMAARALEIARLTRAAQAWARDLRLRVAFYAEGPAPMHGTAVVRVEYRRADHLEFSPLDAAGVPGPLEQALVGVEVGEAGAKASAIQHVVRSFDPCMVVRTAH